MFGPLGRPWLGNGSCENSCRAWLNSLWPGMRTFAHAHRRGLQAAKPAGTGRQWRDRHICDGAASDISSLSWGQRLRGSAARMEPGRMEPGLESRRPLPGTVGVTVSVSAWGEERPVSVFKQPLEGRRGSLWVTPEADPGPAGPRHRKAD